MCASPIGRASAGGESDHALGLAVPRRAREHRSARSAMCSISHTLRGCQTGGEVIRAQRRRPRFQIVACTTTSSTRPHGRAGASRVYCSIPRKPGVALSRGRLATIVLDFEGGDLQAVVVEEQRATLRESVTSFRTTAPRGDRVTAGAVAHHRWHPRARGAHRGRSGARLPAPAEGGCTPLLHRPDGEPDGSLRPARHPRPTRGQPQHASPRRLRLPLPRDRHTGTPLRPSESIKEHYDGVFIRAGAGEPFLDARGKTLRRAMPSPRAQPCNSQKTTSVHECPREGRFLQNLAGTTSTTGGRPRSNSRGGEHLRCDARDDGRLFADPELIQVDGVGVSSWSWRAPSPKRGTPRQTGARVVSGGSRREHGQQAPSGRPKHRARHPGVSRAEIAQGNLDGYGSSMAGAPGQAASQT